MKRATRKSSIIPPPSDVQTTTTVGNFSTRFSVSSFVKQVEKLTVDQKSAITKMGFGNLLEIPNQTLNKSLLSELMYRWSSEKQSFLLQCGEISVTLNDVALILGLRVVGNQVLLTEEDPFLDLEEDFGASPAQRKIAISTLESKLDALDGIVNDDFVRTFLLYMFGTFLFPTANSKVDSRYLSFLKDLDNVAQFAWGAAVLDDLFMWLSKRKDMNVQYVGGCLLFLQVWSYEHIDIARPNLLDNHMTFPRACRWENGKSHQRQHMTAKFKELQKDQITWKLDPFSNELEIEIIKELLEKENRGMEFAKPEESLTKASIVNEDGLRSISEVLEPIAAEVKDESKMDTVNEEQPASQVLDQIAAKVKIEMHTMNEVNQTPWVPEPNSEQPMTSTIQELNAEQPASQVLDQIAAKVKIEMHTMNEVNQTRWVPEPNSEQPMTSTVQYPSTSNYATETFEEDELRTRYKMLEEECTKLKEELEKQRCENMLLKDKLQSMSLLEEQNEELKKEVVNLRAKNENVSSSSNDFVDRLERIILEGGF